MKLKKQLILQKKPINLCKICFKPVKISSFHHAFNGNNYLCKKCMADFKPYFKSFILDGVGGLAVYKYDNFIKEKLFLFKGCRDYELRFIFLYPYKKELHFLFQKYKLIPIPSYAEHDKNRGFNHVFEIFSALELPFVNALIKTKDKKKADLKYSDRVNNKGIFEIKEGFEEKIRGQNILIVDDVCTTGSTLKECIALINSCKPKSIKILVMSKREITEKERELIGENIDILN